MARKTQAWTRKKLNRARLLREAEARAEAKAAKLEAKQQVRANLGMDAALKGCRDI